MKIRSITCFYHPAHKNSQRHLFAFKELIKTGKKDFEDAGCPVQSLRLATTPFSNFKFSSKEMIRRIKELECTALEHGFDYLSVGPALPEKKDSYDLVPEIMKSTRQVFCSGSMTTARGEISVPAVFACAKIIEQIAGITPDGFKNLHFAATANVKPYVPFLPAGYAGSDKPAFALAIEGADLAVQAFTGARNLAEARNRLLKILHDHTKKITEIANRLSRLFNVTFKGIDLSLAPFPDESISIGHALEQLGIARLGSSGSLAAAAFLAGILDEGKWKKIGFNGLMLPLLEDAILARRSVESSLSIKDLLLYSTVCGTGLDTIPLPGDTSADQLAAILLDVAFLAIRLNKPLTARLMPVPGKKVGEVTDFNFEFFTNGKILDPFAGEINPPFKASEKVKIKPRF